jgi:hypothetical protein
MLKKTGVFQRGKQRKNTPTKSANIKCPIFSTGKNHTVVEVVFAPLMFYSDTTSRLEKDLRTSSVSLKSQSF